MEGSGAVWLPIVKIIKHFHEGMSGKVSIGSDISEACNINQGVKPGCVRALTPFTLYLATIIETIGNTFQE